MFIIQNKIKKKKQMGECKQVVLQLGLRVYYVYLVQFYLMEKPYTITKQHQHNRLQPAKHVNPSKLRRFGNRNATIVSDPAGHDVGFCTRAHTGTHGRIKAHKGA